VTQDDLLYRFRLRVFAIAGELGKVRAACRAMGIHPSTYYRWKRQLDRHGPEILRPRERRPPRMANQTSVLVEQRVVAFALGHPGFGPARIAAEPNATAGSPATPPHRCRNSPRRRRSGTCTSIIQLSWSRLDWFCIGRLRGTKGTVWQYTAIDVASAYTWATLQVTRRNPSAVWTSALAQKVAADLAARGWRLERVMTTPASSAPPPSARPWPSSRPGHRFIRAGRPQTMAAWNGSSRRSWRSAGSRRSPAT
jgi:Helix-turn-helix domain